MGELAFLEEEGAGGRGDAMKMTHAAGNGGCGHFLFFMFRGVMSK